MSTAFGHADQTKCMSDDGPAQRNAGSHGVRGSNPLSSTIRDTSKPFENWMVSKLESEIGKPAVASFVEIKFEAFDDGDVCRVEVKASNKPVYLGEDADFVVRMGNSTRALNTRDAMEYIHTHW